MSKIDGWRPVRFDDMFPGMKRNNLTVLFWTALFLINLLLVVGFQYLFVYIIPQPETEFETTHGQWYFEDFSDAKFFEGCEVLDATGGNYGNFYLYRDVDGQIKVVRIHNHSIFYTRYRIDRVNAQAVPAGEDVMVEMEYPGGSQTLRILDQQRFDIEYYKSTRSILGFFLPDSSSKTMGLYIAFAAVLLIGEYSLYCAFRKIVRGE